MRRAAKIDSNQKEIVPKYKITPVTKPRMTRADRWKSRPCVLKFFSFRDKVKSLGISVGEHGSHVVFTMPMPKSWSKKKKAEFYSKPHQQKPDIDNLLKALLDSVYEDDCVVYDIRATKVWGHEGAISINNTKAITL